MRILGEARLPRWRRRALMAAAMTIALSATPCFATDMTQTLSSKAATQATNTPINVDAQDTGGQNESDPYRRDGLFSGNRYKVDTKINDNFSVNSSLRFEPAQTSLDGGTAAQSQVYLDQMYVKYEWEKTAGLRLGKFENPRFGVANPGPREVGIFGHDSPLDTYESGRALGVNPYVNLGSALTGSSRIDASVFRFDESPFAGNWADYREPDPGAVVTTTPAPPPSVAFALNGSDPFQLRGLGYHLGYQQLSRGTSESDRQSGVAAGLSYGTTLGGTKLNTAAEIGYMRHPDGVHGDDLQPGMALQGTVADQWRAFANYSAARRAAGEDGAAEPTQDRTYGAGIGYSFQSGPNLDLAWNRRVEQQASQDQPTAQDSVGIKVNYGLKF